MSRIQYRGAEDDPHHIMFFEVHDNSEALDVHRAKDHVKQYQAHTNDIVISRSSSGPPRPSVRSA